MAPTVGIDISAYNPPLSGGDWLFVVLKTTEGMGYTSPTAAAQWAFASKFAHRGVYHYARPDHGAPEASAHAQAMRFADDALARGFRPGVDMWQLDCEGTLNNSVTAADWSAFVPAFMAVALARLGAVGFLYVGWSFEPAAFRPLVARYSWWCPDYGPNDGAVHGLPSGVNPVIHQFSSHGGLDVNVIHDVGRWAQLVKAGAPAPDPEVVEMKLLVPDKPLTKAQQPDYVGDKPVVEAVEGSAIVFHVDSDQLAKYVARHGQPQVIPAAEFATFDIWKRS